jgi:hypothetical protein
MPPRKGEITRYDPEHDWRIVSGVLTAHFGAARLVA